MVMAYAIQDRSSIELSYPQYTLLNEKTGLQADFFSQNRLGALSVDGVVFKAKCRYVWLASPTRPCAVKLLYKKNSGSQLWSEFYALHALQSIPSVVNLYGTASVSKDLGMFFQREAIIMELIEGRSLYDELISIGCSNQLQKSFSCYSVKILKALKDMESYKVYHNDLHSQNIMVLDRPSVDKKSRCKEDHRFRSYQKINRQENSIRGVGQCRFQDNTNE